MYSWQWWKVLYFTFVQLEYKSHTEDHEEAIVEFVMGCNIFISLSTGTGKVAVLRQCSIPFWQHLAVPRSTSPICAPFELEVSILCICYTIGMDFRAQEHRWYVCLESLHMVYLVCSTGQHCVWAMNVMMCWRLSGTGSQCLSSPCARACVITAVIGSLCLTYTERDDCPYLKEIAQFLTHQKTLKHLTLSLNVSVVSMHISLLLYWRVVFQQPSDAVY